MRQLSDLTGPWTGFWVQGRVRGQMDVHFIFTPGHVGGSGVDMIAAFRISGSHGPGSAVRFKKKYPWYTVHYDGTWDGSIMSGRWRIREQGEMQSGLFELWPKSDESGLDIQHLEREHEPGAGILSHGP